MANLKIMKLITYLNRKKAWAFLLLLFPAVATYAQWDYDYPISMQVQQKTLSNSLIQSSYNNNYIGVVNEANNTGFWIYEMGASGQVISSHFYSTTISTITVRAFAIEHHGSENIVAGEVDHGNGTINAFLMRCNANGNGSIDLAIELPAQSGYNTTAIDIVQTGFGSNPEFLAICSEDFPQMYSTFPNPVRPYVVKFDKSLNILNTWYYPVAHSQSPVEARLVGTDDLLIVGETGYTYLLWNVPYPNYGIFKMRIKPSTGAMITDDGMGSKASHIMYRQNSNIVMRSPTISSTGNSQYLAFQLNHTASDRRLTVATMDYSLTTSASLTSHRQYTTSDNDDLIPINMSETSSGTVNILYNRYSNGVPNPAWATIQTTNPYGVTQDISYPDPTGSSEAVSGYIRGTTPNDVHFASINANGELGLTYTTTTANPPCYLGENMVKINSHWIAWDNDKTNAMAANPQPVQIALNLGDPTGQMRDCNGNIMSSFKKDPIASSIEPFSNEQNDLTLQKTADGIYVLMSESGDLSSVRVTALDGKEIISLEGETSVQLDLQAYPAGFYMVSVLRGQDDLQTFKIVR